MKLNLAYDTQVSVNTSFGTMYANEQGVVLHADLTTEAAQAIVRGLANQLGWKIDTGTEVARYISKRLPKGYDTILGYLAKNFPDRIVTLGEEGMVASTTRDGFWCKNECRRRGLTPIKVKAPLAANEDGIEKVNAYPVEVLQARFG